MKTKKGRLGMKKAMELEGFSLIIIKDWRILKVITKAELKKRK